MNGFPQVGIYCPETRSPRPSMSFVIFRQDCSWSGRFWNVAASRQPYSAARIECPVHGGELTDFDHTGLLELRTPFGNRQFCFHFSSMIFIFDCRQDCLTSRLSASGLAITAGLGLQKPSPAVSIRTPCPRPGCFFRRHRSRRNLPSTEIRRLFSRISGSISFPHSWHFIFSPPGKPGLPIAHPMDRIIRIACASQEFYRGCLKKQSIMIYVGYRSMMIY